MKNKRVFLIVLDSFGVGEAPDSKDFGDEGSDTLRAISQSKEFDAKTLESKLCKGLYATGEVLDVDGDCGGYNLQFAYSSACAVAEGIK